ncbi:hypothetical protein M3Y94_00152800 [Aphelenchoides besseyi]|nr:hypothetical protein M3Y94_00152800 [Aphelenchoides besseyi]KAI6237144.1 hypothetical protein M3Y95_00234100 [Aphelenchoides besseyi]
MAKSKTKSRSPTDTKKSDVSSQVKSDGKPDDETNYKAIATSLKNKHPLQNKWTFWYLNGDRSKDWEDCLKEVVTIETIEDFWSVYKKILLPSSLLFGSDYYLFREGIKPMWEDPQNVKGGRWFTVVDKHYRSVRLDELWLKLMMSVIGEQFDNQSKFICGAAVNLRQKGDKVALWTTDSSADKVNRRIGLAFKAKLNIVHESIRYEVHRDASARTGSIIKPKFVITQRSSDDDEEIIL